MALARSLPLNVQALICSYLPRPLRPALTRLPLRARFASSVSLAGPEPFFQRAQPLQADSQHAQHAQAVFDDPSDEYLKVPLSTLDHPAVPRSPDDSLLALLDAGKFPDARKLLHELRASGQAIPGRYAFCHHARRAASANKGDLLARNEHGERDWLEWWKLAPSITDPVHPEIRNLRDSDKVMAKTAGRLIEQLRAVPAFRGAGDLDEAFALLEEFCLVLCHQGHARVVAAHAFPYLTAYAPPEVGERIFAAALRAVRRQRVEFVAQGAYLSDRRRPARYRTRFYSAQRTREIVASLVQSRVATMRVWFLNRQQTALRALASARGGAVLAHANLGRLETAVDMLVATGQGVWAAARIKLDQTVYLRLLGVLADRDEFTLFERVYDSLRASSRRLTRTRSAGMRMRTPYLIRGTAFDPTDAPPSAREAFLAWRYQNAVSAIEEGPELDALVEEDLRAATREHGVPLNRDVYGNRSVRLVRLVENDDAHGSRFPDSARIVAESLIDVGVPGKRIPSANALAVWMLHARKLAEHDLHYDEVLESLTNEAYAQPATRSMWAVATMLAEIKCERYLAAVHVFKAHFDVVALAPRLQAALWAATHDRRPIAERREQGGLPPSAYTLALLVQALVPFYAARATTARRAAGAEHARTVILELYDELLDVVQPAMVPSNTRARAARQDGADISPLDPHTFTPFLLDHLRHRSPLAAARVLADMHARRIPPQGPHFSIVLNAFARGGTVEAGASSTTSASTTVADLLFLLAHFERRPADAAAQRGVSPSVGALAPLLPLPPPQTPLGVHAYTGILSGLRRRGERDTAMEVLRGLADARGEELRGWATGDERFREEVALLGRASGVRAAEAL